MEIKSLVIKEGKVEIKIFSPDTCVKTGQILELTFNNDIWYFEIKEITIRAIDINKPYALIKAETYGRYRTIESHMAKVYDFGKMIGLELDIITDKNLLEQLKIDNTLL